MQADSLPAEPPGKPHPLPPLLLLPSVFPSIRIFSRESALCIRQTKYECWISLQSKGLSSLQQNNSKASVLRHSAFFMAKLSHSYMTFGKTIALTMQTFFGKVMSLLFNMLSGFVIIFFPRNKHLLISWLQSLSIVILEPKKIKSATASTFSPSIGHK